MADHNTSEPVGGFRWEQIPVPASFEPEQALGKFLDQQIVRSTAQQLFPAILQLNGTVAEFVRDYSRLIESAPGIKDLQLRDLIYSQIEPDSPGGEYDTEKSENERPDPPLLAADPSGDRLDLIIDDRFLTLMAQAYLNPDFRPLVDRVKSISLGLPLKDSSFSIENGSQLIRWTVDDETGDEAAEEIAITAIIDDGVPLGHQKFRNDLTDTRIEFAWVQDGLVQGGQPVPFGREFTKDDLDQFLIQSSGGTDEDAFYRRTGQADFSDLTPRNRLGFAATHGSHVGVIAAGHPGHPLSPIDDVADPGQNPIIAVQLPTESTQDTTGLSLAPYLYQAIHYVFSRADQIARDRGIKRISLVINFSFGFLTAPHDGTHPIEKFLDQMLAARNAAQPGLTEIVLPSGNSRELRCHAELALCPAQKDEPAEMLWRVLPDDRTFSYGILYLPNDDTERDLAPDNSRLEVRLSTPDGLISPPMREVPNTAAVLVNTQNQIVGILYYQYKDAVLPDGTPIFRGQYWFGVAQTYTETLGEGYVLPGNWPLTVTRLSDEAGDLALNAYIQRDDTLPGYATNGRQSYFDDPNYVRFGVTGLPQYADTPNAYCKRDGTLNGIASGVLTTTVSGMMPYRGRVRAAPYSAGGPSAGGTANQNPDIAALSDESFVRWGRLTVGSRAGSWYRISGTSIAAPIITRHIAREMIAGTWNGKADLAGLPAIDASDPNQIGREPKRVGVGLIRG